MLTPFNLLLLVALIVTIYDLIYNPTTKLIDVAMILVIVYLLAPKS